jgi:hypothetical protein
MSEDTKTTKQKLEQQFLRKFISMGDPGNIQTEQFKRPDHADFKLATELQKEEFSGWRHNKIGGELELWVNGKIKGTLSTVGGMPTQEAIHALMAKEFGLYE